MRRVPSQPLSRSLPAWINDDDIRQDAEVAMLEHLHRNGPDSIDNPAGYRSKVHHSKHHRARLIQGRIAYGEHEWGTAQHLDAEYPIENLAVDTETAEQMLADCGRKLGTWAAVAALYGAPNTAGHILTEEGAAAIRKTIAGNVADFASRWLNNDLPDTAAAMFFAPWLNPHASNIRIPVTPRSIRFERPPDRVLCDLVAVTIMRIAELAGDEHAETAWWSAIGATTLRNLNHRSDQPPHPELPDTTDTLTMTEAAASRIPTDTAGRPLPKRAKYTPPKHQRQMTLQQRIDAYSSRVVAAASPPPWHIVNEVRRIIAA